MSVKRLAIWMLAATAGTSVVFGQVEQPNPRPPTNQPARRAVPAPAMPADPRPQPGQPPQPDPVSEMIKKLDPELVSRLKGANVTVEVVGDQVILQGPEEAVATLELLIRGLDREWEPKVLEVVTVSERDAAEIARTVQDAIRKAKRTPNQRPEDEISITALSSNILLVAALPSEIDEVLDIIAGVDSIPDPLGKIELMSFDVKFRKAGEVAKELEKIVTQIRQAAGQKKDQTKLQIIPIPANNTIMVTARETEREKIQTLIDGIDVEPKKGWGETRLTVFPLLHSQADGLSKVIQDLIKAETKGDKDAVQETIQRLRIAKANAKGEIRELPPIDLQRTLRIIPDKETNSLIVATVEENVEPMGELIRLLDGVPLGEQIAVKLFPLRFGDAKSMGEMIKKMFDDSKKLPEDPDGSGKGAVPDGGAGAALVYNLGVASDIRTNTMIVSGREEQLTLVTDIVAKLDQPGTSVKFPLKLLALEYSNATQVGKIVTELFDQRLESAKAMGAEKAALEREKVFLSTDIRSNSMIVSASEENFAEIVAIARQLDTRPAKLFDQIRIVRCNRLSAADLKTKIEDLWKRKADLRREEKLLEDLPIVVADERSNALIIASSVEDYEEIERLVDVLESQPLIEATQIFKLAFADSKVIAEIMDKLFKGMAGNSEKFKAPTIIPDSRSNALLIAGSRDSMERAADVLKRLDIEAGPQTAVFKVYALKFGSSAQLAPRMQKLFDSRKEGDDAKRTPIVILADESSNSLVCSASRDDHDIIAGLLGLLDKPSNIAKQFEIFPLKLARAAKVAENLEKLFKSQGQASGGGGGRADAIAAQADERTNSIIVWASPTQMTNIAEVVARLDTSAPAVDMMVKVIQLKQALADDFSKLLEQTIIGDSAGKDGEKAVIVSFLEKDAQGREVVRKLLRQDIKIKPDPRTNSLMVMAPSDSMAMLEAMIRDFDKIRPITSEIRLFPLINSDAKTMVEQLTEIFKTESGGEGKSTSTPVFGTDAQGLDLASVGQELRFAADPRTNTLIAAGAPVYLTMVEDLVRWLDAQAAENRVSEVYNAKFRPASDLSKAVKGFIDQELNVLGEGDTEESRLRRQERQVSVESVGEQDKGSSSLLVGTSPRAYQRTMELIQNLDRPEPQVMISVLIAEVTLNNTVDLGIEIAGQDLSFSKDAVVGSNGIVQGEDFDFIGGTDLGAAGLGLGGFNFTITGEDFSFLFRALQQDSRLEVLSRPILMVRNGEEGKITIADQVPIVQSSQLNPTGQTQSTIGREDVGIVLTATPHISPDGYVTIDMKQEISNVGASVQLTEGVSSPIFQTREVQTNVTIRDGETVVIGGLIQSNDSQSESKVPILGDIPLLGVLFRTNSVSNRKTELLVVLTVDVLRTNEDVKQMSAEQRDKFELPDNIRQHPLMEGLRITPQEQALGPQPDDRKKKSGAFEPSPAPDQRGNEPFGPKPRTYGPAINRTPPSRASTPPKYGPKIARGEETIRG